MLSVGEEFFGHGLTDEADFGEGAYVGVVEHGAAGDGHAVEMEVVLVAAGNGGAVAVVLCP